MTDPTPCTRCGHIHERCAGHSRRNDGRPCGNRPLAGQTVCRMHGGAAKQNKAAAERRITEARARQALATFGHPHVIDPHAALLEELHRTAGAVHWLTTLVAELDEDDVVWGITREKTGGDDHGTTSEATTNAWIVLYQAERKHLVAVAKACIDAGIEEKRVELEQARVRLQAEAVQAGLEAAQLSEEQRATVIRVMLARLRAIEAGGDTA